MSRRGRAPGRWTVVAALLGGLLATLSPALSTVSSPAVAAGRVHRTAASRPARPAYVPRIRHVFVINLENKGYAETFGPGSKAPYLARTLRRKGVLLTSFYGVAHESAPNYIAQISGQAPNSQTQTDCQTYSPFVRTGAPAPPGQAVGSGCVYSVHVPNLPRQLTHRHLTWRAYMQQMSRPCEHPRLGQPDPTQHATKGHGYAVRHDPFMYFRSITGHPAYCRHRVRPLADLARDLRHVRTTRRLSYITPDLCRDGHDNPCANGQKGGLVQVDRFLRVWAPRILGSPAFRRNGMLVITADESDGPTTDSTACCGEQPGPNLLLGSGPGITGPGGGLVGALVISRFTRPDTWSTTPYNHYSLLGSLEELFRLPKLGMAAVPGLPVFGLDVYNSGWWTR